MLALLFAFFAIASSSGLQAQTGTIPITGGTVVNPEPANKVNLTAKIVVEQEKVVDMKQQQGVNDHKLKEQRYLLCSFQF